LIAESAILQGQNNLDGEELANNQINLSPELF
jgi:hypothetical protein